MLYRAAIQQFEDLMDAAASAGPSGSPLPLYYAVSQAGRAILSVREPNDEKVFATLEHHGLGVPRSFIGDDLMTTRVVPKSAETGQFQRVAAAIGSPLLTGQGGVELGALLASLPETGDELWTDDRWPLTAGVQPLMRLTQTSTVGDLGPVQDAAEFFAGRLHVAIVADGVESQQDLAEFARCRRRLNTEHLTPVENCAIHQLAQ
jgi:hypothetical protein